MRAMRPDQQPRLQQLLRQGLAAAGVPGGAAAVVSATQVIATAQVGDMQLGDPMMLGSTSKSITGQAVRQLAEQGLIDLHAPLRTYLQGAKVLPDATVREVAQHRSGLRSDSTLAKNKKFRYANQNYNYLGELVEQVSGLPFLEYVQRNIAPGAGASAHYGHGGIFGHWYRARKFSSDRCSWIQPPSGALTMSTLTAAQYLQDQLAPPFLPIDAAPADHSPAVAGIFGELGNYGFGWIEKEHAGHKIYLHSGKVPGATSVFALIPGLDRGMVLLVPYGEFLCATPLVEKIAEALLQFVMGEEPTSMSAVGRDRRVLHWKTSAACFAGLAAAIGLAMLSRWVQLPWLGLVIVIAGAVGFRVVSGTPTRWMIRFVPELFVVLVLALLCTLAVVV